MSTANPYVDDPARAPIWDQGYAEGYEDPEVEHDDPVAVELVDAYREGERAGRDDRRAEVPFGPPPPDAAPSPDAEAPVENVGEAIEDIVLEVGTHKLSEEAWTVAAKEAQLTVTEQEFFGAVGGLIALVLTVVQIPGGDMLHQPDPEWTGSTRDLAGSTYLGVCPEIHMVPSEGVTTDGYWVGAARQSYADAESDAGGHGHEKAFVAMCSVETGLCAPVTRATP